MASAWRSGAGVLSGGQKTIFLVAGLKGAVEMISFRHLLVAGLLSAAVLWGAPSHGGGAAGKKAFEANRGSPCPPV